MAAQYDEGRYWVKVLSQAFGKSKNKGTPEFSLRVLVKGRVNPEAPDGDLFKCNQAERTIYLYITEGTAEYVLRDLERIGFDKPSFRYLDPQTEHYHNFADAEFEAFCDHEEYQGETKEKWRFAKPRGAAADAAPLEADEIRKLDALFGKQLSKVASRKGNGAPPAAPPPAEKPAGNGNLRGVSTQQAAAAGVGRDNPSLPPTEDEIPF